MRPWYTTHALAIAARRANVAGVVRLTCGPDTLEIELIRVTGFALGFAPGAVADPVAFRVPYTAVRGLVREGRLLYLALDPAVVTPFNRFALARFSDDASDVLARAHDARARARWTSALLPVPAGALAAALVPDDLAGGIVGRLAVGAVAALAAWGLLRGAALWRTWGGPFSDRLRERFEKELAERLALVPADLPAPTTPSPARARSRSFAAIVAGDRPPITPAPHPVASMPAASMPLASLPTAAISTAPLRAAPAPRERGSLSVRSFAAALAAAVGVVLVVAFLGRFAVERPAPPSTPAARSGLAAAVRAIGVDVRPPPEPPRCLCVRADSPLWKDGVPVLSVLTFGGDEEPIAEPAFTLDGKGFPKYRFDLAIVNNGARGLRDVRLTLTFARHTGAGKRVGAVDRGLFWGGVLAGGHAAKWHVAAPGNELRTDVNVSGTLASANLDPAPADAFFGLLSARVRAVRVHGALMLAYLRDPRADAAARALAAQSTADAEILARVRRAAAKVIACDVRRAADHVEACVFNGSASPRAGVSLREVVTTGAEPRAFAIDAPIPVHEGFRVRFPAPADLAAELSAFDPAAAE